VDRWAERIRYDQLVEVSLDKAIVGEVVQKLGDLSRYIVAHLHSDAFIGQKPTPADLFAEIQSYEELKSKTQAEKSSPATGCCGEATSVDADTGTKTGRSSRNKNDTRRCRTGATIACNRSASESKLAQSSDGIPSLCFQGFGDS